MRPKRKSDITLVIISIERDNNMVKSHFKNVIIYAEYVICIRKNMTIKNYCGSIYITRHSRNHKYLHHSFLSQSKNAIKNSRLLITGADTAIVKTLQKIFIAVLECDRRVFSCSEEFNTQVMRN